jgi:hypothetical protein
MAFYPDRWKKLGNAGRLITWPGHRVVFLTTQKDWNGLVMGRLVRRLDDGWSLYAELTGRSPRLFKNIDGKSTVAAVPEGKLTCGYGCGYVGSTGIEVAGFYDKDYPLLCRNPNAFPHYYFYEMGRNFYTFGNRHSLFTTGYAVFMRYVCMDTLKCYDPDRQTRLMIEKAEGLYSRTDVTFLQAFTTLAGIDEKTPRLKQPNGRPLNPSDQPVMYASAMLKLWQHLGGRVWLKRFFAELAKCPEIKPDSEEAALCQSFSWLVAVSCAARHDVSSIFVDRWHFPLTPETRKALKKNSWKKASADTVLKKIVPQFTPSKCK